MIIVDLLCKIQRCTTWCSQQINNGMCMGNTNISAGILFSGNTFQRIKEIIIANVAFTSQLTFYSIRKKLLYPVIHWVYTTNRTLLFESAKEESKSHLLGDGRCDSPGYNAKYGTYTLRGNQSGQILDFHISHVQVAGNSQKMELDGFKTVINRLQEYDVKIGSITTDRHNQIQSYVSKFLKHILYQFYVWHVRKNIKKKLNLKETWIGILYHITDCHQWKGYKTFRKCQHKKLTKKGLSCKPFLKQSSPAYKALESIVTD